MKNRCPRCAGDGGYHALVHREAGCTEEYLPCSVCHGAGYISDEVAGWIKEGSDHRNARVERMESLRECARRLGLSPALISAMETGRERPRFKQFCMGCNADDPPHAPDCTAQQRIVLNAPDLSGFPFIVTCQCGAKTGFAEPAAYYFECRACGLFNEGRLPASADAAQDVSRDSK